MMWGMSVSAHVFIAVSLDGFIAREDGGIDWLMKQNDQGEDHGYHAFIADKDAIVMGRGSFEKVLEFEEWYYDRPVIVMSQGLDEGVIPKRLEGKVRISRAAGVGEMLAELESVGVRKIYVDGGKLVTSFLRAGAVVDMTITTIPILIGRGRRLFGELERDVDLKLEWTRGFASGMVQSRYRVVGGSVDE